MPCSCKLSNMPSAIKAVMPANDIVRWILKHKENIDLVHSAGTCFRYHICLESANLIIIHTS